MDNMIKGYTKAEYDLLPEGFPAQLVEGQLVREAAPAFGHQRIVLEVAKALDLLVGPRRTGVAPVDVPIDAWNVYQPDVVVFRRPMADDERGRDGDPPLLVVEVLSPSTAHRDRSVKRIRLLDAGVDEVWLVDPAGGIRSGGVVEVYDRGRYRDIPRRALRDVTIASHVLEGFELEPKALFDGV